ENVGGMRKWSKYRHFVADIQGMGYEVSEQLLNAADFGVPQRRRRLFLLCDKMREPAQVLPTHSKHMSACSAIQLSGGYSVSPLHTKTRAKATLERAERAIAAVGERSPFLLVYYGSDYAGGWQNLNEPLRTITTLDRFALVKPRKHGHVLRMLQVP